MSYRRRRHIIHPGGGAPPPPKKRYAPGWWTVCLHGDLYNGAGAYTGMPAAADIASSAGVCASHDWIELEPNGKTDPPGSGVGQRFSGLTTILAPEVAACAAMNGGAGRAYMVRIGVKSFRGLGTNPLPIDMQQPFGTVGQPNYSPDGYATYFPGSSSIPDGYGAMRWHPIVQARFTELTAAIGAMFGTNVLFVGINTQETALGFNPDARRDGYTPALYNAALINEPASIAAASPYFRPFSFVNFHPGQYTDAAGTVQHTSIAQGTIYLAQVAAGAQQYGTVLAFPDLVTQNAGIINRVYDIHAAYQSAGTVTRAGTTPLSVTMPGSGPIGGSMQHDELSGVGVGDSPVVTENLFNWGTQSFHYGVAGSGADHTGAYTGAIDHRLASAAPGPFNLDFLFVNLTGGSPARHMYPDYPTFGPFVPS